MARGSAPASTAATTALSNSGTFAGNAGNLYSDLAPQLETEAAHPSGFDAPDLAAMQTEGQQGAGGAEAGAVGEGMLHAARTRNAGGADAAIGEGVRSAGENLSKNALGVRIANAKLKNQQQQEGLGGLTNLTGLETGAENQALGEVAPAVNADVNQQNASWDWAKDLLDPTLQAAGYSGKGFSI